MSKHAGLALAAMMMGFAPVMAAAQAPPTPATPPAQTAPQPPPQGDGPRGSRDCAPSQNSTQGQERNKGATGEGGSLSERLAQSDGVICPPADIGPEIRVPAPDGGTSRMPVIPPAGSPGGDPTIRPK